MSDRRELGSYREAYEQYDTPNRYGPAVKFLGVPRPDLAKPETFANAVVIGVPFDGGTTYLRTLWAARDPQRRLNPAHSLPTEHGVGHRSAVGA